MKKFPFSKKAVNVMLATALVATPLAVTVPVADSVAVAQQQTLKSAIDDRLTQENVNTTAVQLSKDLASLTLATTKAELEAAITTLQSETNEAAIAAVFGEGTTSDDLIEAVALTFQSIQTLHGDKSKEDFSRDVVRVGYEAFGREAINEAISKHPNEVGSLNTRMQNNIGIGFTGLFTVLIDLEEAIGTFDLEAKQDFAEAMFDVQKEMQLPTNPTKADLVDFVSSVYGKLSPDTIKVINTGKTKLDNLREDQWENILGVSVSVPTPPPDPGPGPSPTPDPDPDPTPGPVEPIPINDAIEVEIDGDRAIHRVNAEMFADIIHNAEQVERVTLTITKGEGQTGELVIPTAAIEALAEVNVNAVVDVTTDEGSISLPVSELRDEALRTRLGVTEGDVELSIAVNAVADSAERVAELGINAKSPIVEFSIVARSGDVEAPVNRFVQYFERDLVLSEDVNPDRTVVVRVNADGTLTVVPTIVRDGRVTFKSFTNSYYVAVEREASFTDLRDDYWAKEQIEKLAVRDIFQGRQDGTVAPGEPVTRVQLAVLITRALALVSDVEYDGRFVDVQGDEWFMGEFMAAIEAGIVLGRQDGTFSPNEPVNRQQAAAMISRAMEHIGYNEADLDTTKSITQYPDAERIGEWAEADVERLLQAGIMEGRNTGLFDPTDETTRAQMAAMLERFLIFSDLMNE